jgi:ribA/ribD-fused uncharacterized protein
MRITDTHVYFFTSEDIFSNFHHSPFLYRRKVNDLIFGEITQEYHFKNSEQAFMFEKALYFEDFETAEKCIIETDPKKVKKLGREVSNFNADKWDEVSFDKMYNVCFHKYTFNKEAHKALIETGNRILVEASPYDLKWGVGLSKGNDQILFEKNWKGENRLGNVLMKGRKDIL